MFLVWITGSLVYLYVISDSVSANGAHLMNCHPLEVQAALPAHTFVTTGCHRCVFWCFHANDALTRILVGLFNSENLHNEFLLLEWQVRSWLLRSLLDNTSLVSHTNCNSLLQLGILLVQVLGGHFRLIDNLCSQEVILVARSQRILEQWRSYLWALPCLDLPGLQLAVDLEEEHEGVDAHYEQEEQG